MSEDLSNKCVISAALCGAVTRKEQNPAIPITPEEYAAECKKCYEAGAAIVHLHMRDPETQMATPELKFYRSILKAIKEECPEILINLSSAISINATDKQRIAPIKEFGPELASLNSASMNFGVGNWKTGDVVVETIFSNTFRLIGRLAGAMRKAGTKPEIEIYDAGGLQNIDFLQKKKILDEPLHFQFVFGVLGGLPFTIANLDYFLRQKPPNATWSVCGVAHQQFEAGLCAAGLGGHIRVGLEDNIRNIKGELAKGSWEQVEWAVKVAELAGREPATPEETRKILHLKEGTIKL
ncbi:MAG: 3-keto-5-aminohexanoate cleavage protein [Promethearchaeota archaeon]|nr:MAG: 3-keto-5-aminohexanoate cleavage protein [Candidatus Lokiarchaeota archaeon]